MQNPQKDTDSLNQGSTCPVPNRLILKLHFCPPEFYHLNVIQNEATVCFRTMRTPPSSRKKAVWSVYPTGEKIKNNNSYVPPILKTKVAPLL